MRRYFNITTIVKTHDAWNSNVVYIHHCGKMEVLLLCAFERHPNPNNILVRSNATCISPSPHTPFTCFGPWSWEYRIQKKKPSHILGLEQEDIKSKNKKIKRPMSCLLCSGGVLKNLHYSNGKDIDIRAVFVLEKNKTLENNFSFSGVWAFYKKLVNGKL